MTTANPKPKDVTLIKKYANRRLYDTGRSSYVTLADLCEMVQEGHDFRVEEAKTGKDITRAVLAQIVAEQESGSEESGLMPTDFMKSLVGFYGDSMKGLMPTYLQSSMDAFIKNQEQFRKQWTKSFENMPGMQTMQDNMKNMPNFFGTNVPASMEDMARKNMELFQTTMTNTMKMFTPFTEGTYKDDDKKQNNG